MSALERMLDWFLVLNRKGKASKKIKSRVVEAEHLQQDSSVSWVADLCQDVSHKVRYILLIFWCVCFIGIDYSGCVLYGHVMPPR